MANTAFLILNSGFGNVGQAPPNAVVYADILVKNPQDQVLYSQPSGCSVQLTYGDTYAAIAARLTACARNVMNDQSLQVTFL